MKIKYMGSADEAILKKGESFGGRLSEEVALGKDVVWDQSNNWTLDTEEAGISQEFAELLLENDGDRFKDVTDLKRIPASQHQRLFHGAKKEEKADPGDTPTGATAESGEVQPGGSLVEGGDAGGTTVGGSTAGDGAGGGARRGRASTAGGSTD